MRADRNYDLDVLKASPIAFQKITDINLKCQTITLKSGTTLQDTFGVERPLSVDFNTAITGGHIIGYGENWKPGRGTADISQHISNSFRESYTLECMEKTHLFHLGE
jgi:hypothetical protein